MVRLRCICLSFMCRRSCIEAKDLDKPKAPARDRRGFSLQIFGATKQTSREINNPDAVNLHSLWN